LLLSYKRNIYALVPSGELECMNASDGRERWRARILAAPVATQFGVVSARNALRHSDGASLFNREGQIPKDSLFYGAIIDSQGRLLTIQKLRYSDDPDKLMALDAKTGAVLAERPVVTRWPFLGLVRVLEVGEIPGAPGWLFLAGRATLLTIDGGVNGKARGLHYLGYKMGWICAGHGRIYVASRRGVMALDRRAMTVWSSSEPVNRLLKGAVAAPVLTRTRIILWDGRTAVALSVGTGRLIWKSKVSAHKSGYKSVDPVGAGQVLYVVGSSAPGARDQIVALGLTDGKRLWSTKVDDGEIINMIAHKGALYAITWKKTAEGHKYTLTKYAPKSAK